jgi:hypothetical protein
LPVARWQSQLVHDVASLQVLQTNAAVHDRHVEPLRNLPSAQVHAAGFSGLAMKPGAHCRHVPPSLLHEAQFGPQVGPLLAQALMDPRLTAPDPTTTLLTVATVAPSCTTTTE